MHPNTFPSLSSRSIPFPSTTTILIRHYTASILGPEGAFAVYERRLLSQEGCLTPFHIWAYRQFVTVRVERTSPSYTLSRFLCLSCARILSFFSIAPIHHRNIHSTFTFLSSHLPSIALLPCIPLLPRMRHVPNHIAPFALAFHLVQGSYTFDLFIF